MWIAGDCIVAKLLFARLQFLLFLLLSPEHEIAFKISTASDTTEKVIKVVRSDRFVLFLYATATNCVRSVAQTNDDDDGMREKIQPGDEPRTPLSSTQIELALLGSSRIDSIGIIEN